ncbi:hypothetical protein [Saccharothrix sp. ST-888]|uniref:hypothetical protein n=1 Tax=Saccharothrix sp. ST-888 TaxID=1427391 RepID=UPI0007C7233B|nr:hypothetical protein [Saccharothrix sp. ST-888]
MRDLVREIVADVAPEELPLVEGLCQSDDESVVRRLSGRNRSREPLGFGLDEVTALVSPVVWLALDEAVRKSVGAAVGSAGRGSRTLLRRILRKPPPARVMPALTAEQLDAVQRRVQELAANSGMEEVAAVVLAERVVARLALPPKEERRGESHAQNDTSTGCTSRCGAGAAPWRSRRWSSRFSAGATGRA